MQSKNLKAAMRALKAHKVAEQKVVQTRAAMQSALAKLTPQETEELARMGWWKR